MKKMLRQRPTPSIAPLGQAVGGVLVLWAALSCPSQEDWLDLMVDVALFHAGEVDLETACSPEFAAIIRHLSNHIAEA